MKKTLLTIALLLAAGAARAGIYYNLGNHQSSVTIRMGYVGADRNDAVFISSGAAIVQSTSATSGHKVFQVKNNAGVTVFGVTQGGALSGSGAGLTGVIATNLDSDANGNTVGGDSAGAVLGAGTENTFIGHEAGFLNISGNNNTAVGTQAGYATTGSGNSFLGVAAGQGLTSGEDNVMVGRQTGYQTTTPNGNTFLGTQAGYSNVTGANNTAIGYLAGGNALGSGNVFLGYNAGYGFEGSNRLAIGNSDARDLITGDFAYSTVTVHGHFYANGATYVYGVAAATAAVGGAAAAGYDFTVNNTAANAIRVTADAGYELNFAGAAGVNIYHSEASQPIYLGTNGGDLNLGNSDGGTNLVVDGPTGYVGINTAAPVRTADINGSGVVRGVFDVAGGSATVSGALGTFGQLQLKTNGGTIGWEDGAGNIRALIGFGSYLDINGNIGYPTHIGDAGGTVTVIGSTLTISNTGVLSAPSQPGMQLYLDANIVAPAASQTRVHWSATASNRASWRKNVVFDTVNSSDVFKTNGAGGYYTKCCISSISSGSSYLYTLVRSPGSTVWLRGRSQNPGSTGEQTVCAEGILELPDADELVCEIQASAQTTIQSGVGETALTFQKVR